ncbi:MAG: RsmD family RNA methyltransferase [Pirellulaceae bacterium]|nr:RsmD family RNA methyltransferase [Pirellulaceae bacterium]
MKSHPRRSQGRLHGESRRASHREPAGDSVPDYAADSAADSAEDSSEDSAEDFASDAASGSAARGGREFGQELPKGRRRLPKESLTPAWLRIVGGHMGGQRVHYNGDPNIRPMKDRTRESVFNLLGGDLTGRLAIDLFAGTGALGFESISRGAHRAVMLEMLRPAVASIVENAQRLKVADQVEVHNVDTLRWLKYVETTAASWPAMPWVVYCCPPYRLWETELPRLREGLAKLLQLSPIESYFVVESEEPFDIQAELPEFDWDVRRYKPAVVGVAEHLASQPSMEAPQASSDEGR